MTGGVYKSFIVKSNLVFPFAVDVYLMCESKCVYGLCVRILGTTVAVERTSARDGMDY